LRLATVTLTLTTVTLHAADLDATALLARLTRPPPDTTAFVEVRYSALLDRPIAVSGQLEHLEDGALVRRVEVPYRETMELRGENVLVDRAGSKPRSFSLDRAPELRGMLSSFGSLLKGDRKSLERYFVMTVLGSDARWRIELIPRDEKLKRRLDTIVVDGSLDRPRCFTLNEPDGDASVMALGVQGPTELPQPLERASLAAWCSGDTGH